MSNLSFSDIRHLEAAQGWLGLKNWPEAMAEIEQISPSVQSHADVLQVRWAIYAAGEDWEMAMQIAEDFRRANPDSPFGFVHLAYALHELRRTKEAQNVLLPVVEKFSDEYIIRYNLACYACQLGDNEAAWRWLEKSMALTDPNEVKRMAMTDADLEPLRKRMREQWEKEAEE
jgi:tetratricopeptide (TPR) repeat protein